MQRVLAAVVVIVAIAGLTAAAAALGGPGEPKPGEARVSLAEGVLAQRLVPPSAVWTMLHDGDLVRTGERVRVRAGRDAVFAFARDVRLTLPAGSELTVGSVPSLESGQLLVETGTGAAARVDAGASSYAVARSSAARLHRSLDAGTAVYAGRVDVSSAGRRLRVPALRAASVPAIGLVPAQPSPMVLHPSDRWDVRFLGAAMDLSAALDAGSAGFSAQAPSVDPDALLTLVPGAAGDSALLRGRRTGDQLVAVAIAAAGPGGFSTRLPSVVSFRDAGASWGLVAMDQTSADERGRLVARVRSAIAAWLGRSGGFAAGGPGAVTATPAPSTAAAAAPVASSTATAPATVPSGGSGDDPTVAPPTPPPTVLPPVVAVPPTPVTVPGVPLTTGTPIDDVIDAIGLGGGR